MVELEISAAYNEETNPPPPRPPPAACVTVFLPVV